MSDTEAKPDLFDRMCSRAIRLYGSPDFEDARSDAWDMACQLVEEGCLIGVDRSQIVLYRIPCYNLRLLVSDADKVLHARIAKGEQLLHDETTRILTECPGFAVREVPLVAKYMDALAVLRAWLARPASMWEIGFESNMFKRIELRNPHKK